jgi:small-conductance mechanosensitive channel
MTRRLLAALALALSAGGVVLAQQPPAAGPSTSPGPGPTTIQAEPSGESATLTYFNRPIVVLRARVLARGPAERASGAARILEGLAAQGVTGPVDAQPFEPGFLIRVGTRGVVGLAPPDVDDLSGDTLEGITRDTVARLQQALAEAHEARTPGVLLRAVALSLIVLTAGLLLLWGISRSRRAAARRLIALSEKAAAKRGVASAEALRATRALEVERRVVNAVALLLDALIVYAVVTFVLRRFPYTRPWGESMRGFLIDTVQSLGLSFAHAFPGFFTVALILVLARLLTRLIAAYFNAVEAGRLNPPPWMHPETAQPTRRLITAGTWLFAIVVAYPYLPGSETEAFKGVSVFVGLMFTLGSAGIVQHVMSGFMITYSRALRVGDFVKIGDVEGTVTQIGILSTKVRTPRREEITIPNAVVTAQTTVDYSRVAPGEGVMTPTSVTIGYDTPWRQIEALLLAAADRTPGIRREPRPLVIQAALEDWYVKYVLMVCLEQQERKALLLHQLHANIQDLFNEYGVQIMSPNYEADPSGPKIVAKKDWYAAPAAQPADQPAGRLQGVEQ